MKLLAKNVSLIKLKHAIILHVDCAYCNSKNIPGVILVVNIKAVSEIGPETFSKLYSCSSNFSK